MTSRTLSPRRGPLSTTVALLRITGALLLAGGASVAGQLAFGSDVPPAAAGGGASLSGLVATASHDQPSHQASVPPSSDASAPTTEMAPSVAHAVVVPSVAEVAGPAPATANAAVLVIRSSAVAVAVPAAAAWSAPAPVQAPAAPDAHTHSHTPAPVPAPRPTTTTTAPVPPSTTTTTAPAVPVGEWRAQRTNPDGTPVRYDPCRSIEYVTRLAGGPAFARAELDWAVAQIEGASGLDLVWAGDVAGLDGGAPVHIGFATQAEFPMPAHASGYGDSSTVDIGGGFRRYTGGRLVVRPDQAWTQGASSANPLGVMFLHELGHVVGLGHVDSPHEVMTDRGNGTARALGAGDRAGLAAVGRPAGCL